MELPSPTLTSLAFLALALLGGSRWLLSKSPLRNVAGPPSPSFILGHLRVLMHRESAPFHLGIPDRYGGIARLRGPLWTDILYVTDPLALYHMVIKDVHLFPIPDFILDVSRIAWGEGILTTEGNAHRRQRKLLIPAFSAAHLRGITPIFQRVAEDLREAVKEAVALSPEMNILDMLSRCALELVGQGALGASFNTLDRATPSAYNDYAKNLFPLFSRIAFISPLVSFLNKCLPASVLRFVAKNIPVYAIRELAVILDYLYDWSIALLRAKRDPSSDHTYDLGEGKDMLSILCTANDDASSEEAMPENELLGQITQLVFAAHDTTSNAMTRVLDLLTKNQDVQERMRVEILHALQSNGTLDYDTLQSLPYLDAVCRETFRVYPTVLSFNRNTAQDTVLPLRFPMKASDGKTELTSVLVPKGTMVIMGLHGPNRNKGIWGDDAQEWKPDRWLKPLPASVAEARVPGVYSHMMTFMGGHHSCIGFKFSELEMKAVMTVLLANFRFFPSESGRKMAWGMGGPMYPYDPSDPNSGPQLDMKVVPLDSDKVA